MPFGPIVKIHEKLLKIDYRRGKIATLTNKGLILPSRKCKNAILSLEFLDEFHVENGKLYLRKRHKDQVHTDTAIEVGRYHSKNRTCNL